MDLVFVDLETTGGVACRDRITEIAIVRCRNGEEVKRFTALINPEQALTPFIRKLTGLTDALLREEPVFAQLAGTILKELSQAVFVAHNSRFDYGFLKQEFARVGIHWQAQNLCTVKLSRNLYPEHRKHGLDQIIERHQIVCEQRHRAMGDALATFKFFQSACEEHGKAKVMAEVERLLLRPSLPPNLATDELDGIPSSPGIYKFLNENGQCLFMGHGRNLFQAITGRFQSGKGPDWSEDIYDIDYQLCAGEFSAQLDFLRGLQQEHPVHQHQRSSSFCSIYLEPDPSGYLQPKLVCEISPDQVSQHYGLFQSNSEAIKALRGLAKAHLLSIEMASLELPAQITQKPKPTPDLFNTQLQAALAGLKLKTWPWPGPVAIGEKERFTGIEQVHLFEHWCYLGTLSAAGEAEIEPEQWQQLYLQNRASFCFDKSIYQLLKKQLLAEESSLQVIPFSLVEVE